MKLSKDVKTKFSKLGISSYTELALLIPNSYEDYRLNDKLIEHKHQLIDATVESVFRAPNTIQITFFVHNFGHSITGVLFRPKPYMMHQFSVGSRDNYYGMIECKQGQCSISMPKKISVVGDIVAKYKCGLRTDVMGRLIKKELSVEKLEEEGIPSNIAQTLLALHFANAEILEQDELDTKSLEALKFTELFSYMKLLKEKRRYFKPLLSVNADYKTWAKSLPFVLTEEQVKTIEDIQNDFIKDIASKRMIVGDVGSGKTMVILASAYMIGTAKSILMAPTTILAQQLYEEALKFLPNLKVTLVTNKSKKANLSEYDFIIGTHALLYRELPSAALVMVDEQHRFGTKQRSVLEKLVSEGQHLKCSASEALNAESYKKPHFLQFSATPIPRTLAMIESAHIDVSLITTTPFTKDIDSKVIHKNDFKELVQHIKAEIKKNNQVLIVYPLVTQSEVLDYQSIEEARSYWETNFNDVYVTHGKDKEKEQILLDFREQGSVLISTTVVEVGISLPRLTTVVIVGAERLGLSTLHQLRGRVSRTGLKGYCYLYTNKSSSERLDKFVETKSGFDIANLDLKFRKSGDLLKGLSQSGNQFRWFDFAEDVKIVKEVKKSLLLE